jgi:hypothetical protein
VSHLVSAPAPDLADEQEKHALKKRMEVINATSRRSNPNIIIGDKSRNSNSVLVGSNIIYIPCFHLRCINTVFLQYPRHFRLKLFRLIIYRLL